MYASLIWLVLVWLQTGGSGPAMTGFWFGAGRIVAVVLAVLVGFVFVALVRAGRRRH